MLIYKKQQAENVDLPPTFWWAEGHEGLEQHWPSGDFATWIDSKDECRAFGVTFDLDGVIKMLPAEERALTARRFSVAGDPAWVNARSALLFGREKAGFQLGHTESTILARARLGFIAAKAVLVERAEAPPGGRPGLTKEEHELEVPDWFWQRFTGQGSSQDWILGTFEGRGSDPEGSCLLKLVDVHFQAETLDVLLPTPVRPPASDPPTTKPGGRPAQAWWDDLWCDVWGMIYEGKLIPNTQADVEKAMLEWAAQRGHSPAESTTRPKARKLFKVFSGGVENPPRS